MGHAGGAMMPGRELSSCRRRLYPDQARALECVPISAPERLKYTRRSNNRLVRTRASGGGGLNENCIDKDRGAGAPASCGLCAHDVTNVIGSRSDRRFGASVLGGVAKP